MCDSQNTETAVLDENLESLEPRSFRRSLRGKKPSTRIDKEESRRERAIQLKCQRAGHLGNVRKRMYRIQEQIAQNVETEGLERDIECYELAFRKFVDVHEHYMQYEDNEENKSFMVESYENQRDSKFQLELSINRWKSDNKREKDTPSQIGSRSVRSVSSNASSKISVRERKRQCEEANLKMDELFQKQILQRQLEDAEAEYKRIATELEERRKREKSDLERRIEVLQAETDIKIAEVFLKLEEDDNCSASSKMSRAGRETPHSVVDGQTNHRKPHDLRSQVSATSSALPIVGTSQRTDFKVRTVEPPISGACISNSGTKNCTGQLFESQPVTHPGFVAPSTLRSNSRLGGPVMMTPGSGLLNQPLTHLSAEAAEFNSCPVQVPNSSCCNHQHPPVLPQIHKFQPAHAHPSQQVDAWMTIADAIRQGPTLPKVDLMKFGGDSIEYSEFVTNFQDNIESQVSDDSQRLTRLLAQCTGKAKESIRSCVSLPVGQRYSEAWKTLLQNFGQPHMVVEAHIRRLNQIQLKKADAPSLMEFARRLVDARRILSNMGTSYVSRLDNEDMIIALMRKLPDESLKRRWANKAGDLIRSKGQADYTDFTEFIQKTAERLNNRFGQELKFAVERESKKINSFATRSEEVSEQGDKVPYACPSCSDTHGVWKCPSFKKASLTERLKIVKQYRLCWRCLEGGHFASACKRGFFCRKQGCGKEHHWLIHPEVIESPRSDGDKDASVNPEEKRIAGATASSVPPANLPPPFVADGSPVTVGAVDIGRPRVCFKVVPVTVSGPGGDKKTTTYAFLDSGSDSTLCLNALVDELGLESTSANYTMVTVNNAKEEKGREVCLQIDSLDGETRFRLDNVLTTDCLPVTTKHFATNEEVTRWPHLEGIRLPEIEDKKVTILIGLNRPDIIDDELEKRKGKNGEPFAVKTRLGWTVYGPVGGPPEEDIHINFVQSKEEKISEQLDRMYNTEFGDTLADVGQGFSVEDRKAMRVMESSTRLVNGHYQVRLPFHRDPPNLPDSHSVASKRLGFLKKKFVKDDKFYEQYSAAMKRYETEGASRMVPDQEVHHLDPIWYLPHHAVYHPKKPNEPRIVFDCASKCGGISLNDELLQGPDNTSTLVGVILRFRVDEVAVAADIKIMFHQVYVAPEDRGALCYLWWPEGDLSKEPKTHQMLVHIFGATSSPSIAGYALRKAADDNKQECLWEAVDAVYRDFYVDDLLKAFADAKHAIIVSKQVQQLLARGGFQLTKWISNSREVVSAFPMDERAPAVKDLNLGSEMLPTDKALGINWDVEEDKFKMVTCRKDYPQNRKGILSSVASIYDPLGFSSPLLLPGREINQELCKMKYGWDDELPTDLLLKWQEWEKSLVNLKDYGIPRCFKPPGFGSVAKAELHHFADASEKHGYGTVSYLRLTNDRGQVHCSFVMGKSRVKPLRGGVTVPKLELTAATLAIRMNELIKKELSGRFYIDSIHFWTDSCIVLRYILNENRRFVTFVANRVAIIREGSKPSQWHHVRSEDNPADYASRGIKPTENEKLQIWLQGPEFLWKDVEEWPQQPQELLVELSDADEGIKKEKATVSVTVIKENFWNSLLERYSSWNRMQRIVAWLIKACRKLTYFWPLLKKGGSWPKSLSHHTDHLSVSELAVARKRIVRFVQRQTFPEEFKATKSDVAATNPRKKGRLAKLKPFVEDGILRVGGRLKHSDLDFDAKHPMIMPGKHHVTEKIVLHYHAENGHVGTHQVLAETRQTYWIVKGVSSVRRVLRNCHECKRQSGRRGEQIIAPLPAVRVSTDEHELIYPFAAVGVDYFGPLYVTRGPSTRSAKKTPTLNKRYGCIFTCLRYRAVHIELANDLSTDSFINAVKRFVGRRGPPTTIYSDNGTNFRGGEVDILKAMKCWNQEQIRTDLQKKEIEWKFNPPAASHHGGVWERLIRSVRRILHSMLGEDLVNEETLTTFLVEVEKIMNDRPITPVSNDPDQGRRKQGGRGGRGPPNIIKGGAGIAFGPPKNN